MELRICLFGFGEAGQILAADLAARGLNLSAWDVKFADPTSPPSRAIAHHGKVRAASDANDAVHGANVILCAVTADQALVAARAATASLAAGACFVDLNSVSPDIKQQAADIIHAGAGLYIEAAVMSAFPAQRLAVPLYLGGPHAGNFLGIAQAMGLQRAALFSTQIGAASAAKMCRSIIVKGMEALVLESMLTARHYGVEQAVLESLADLLPAADWRALSRYMISRALLHGRRRAAEMHEVCAAVAAARLVPIMSSAIAQRQAWAAEQGANAAKVDDGDSLELLLDSIRQGIPSAQVLS